MTYYQGAGRGAHPDADHPYQLLPQLANVYEPQHDDVGGPIANTLYDPTVEATLEKVARLSGQYERAVIAVVGHADSSMKGRGAPVRGRQAVLLGQGRGSQDRRSCRKYKFDPNKFIVEGKAWDVPANPDDPNNQALNRRVEISVYPPEAK